MPQTLHRCELRVDVTGSVRLPGKIEIAATAFLPDPSSLSDLPIAMFAFPGGGYSRGYYDLQCEGHNGYSQAEFHVARGAVFVALDHLGVGESTLTCLDSMYIEDIAKANDAAVREIMRRLEAGALAPGYPAMRALFKVGIGQSMGAGLTMIMQGRHRTYDAIAPLGYSAIHTVMPQRTEADVLKGLQGHGRNATRETDPRSLSMLRSIRSTVDFIYPFHWEDVPKDILDADMDGGFPVRKRMPRWGSATIPNCVVGMMAPGFVAKDVAEIDIPVLLAMGERDVVPAPLNEPAAFKKSTDVSVFVIPRMAHMHNFASTRQLLWQRLDDWSNMIARHSFNRPMV